MSIFGKDEEETMENRKIQENDVDALIALLDGRTQAGDSRIKLDIVEGQGEVVARQYHHGRCDVGSPWACGTAFDVLED
jgi:hypothetical protein